MTTNDGDQTVLVPVNLEVLRADLERVLEITQDVDLGISRWPADLLAGVSPGDQPDPLLDLVNAEVERRMLAGETWDEIGQSTNLVTKEIAKQTIPEDHKSAARLLLARARYQAGYGLECLEAGITGDGQGHESLLEAARASCVARADLQEGLYRLVRPNEFARASRPPLPAGCPPKAPNLDFLLYRTAEEFQQRDGLTIELAIDAAISSDHDLTLKYFKKSTKARRSAYKRGKAKLTKS